MDQHGLVPEWHIAEWLNTSAPIRLEAQRGRVVVACASQMLCPGCVTPAIPQLEAVNRLFASRGAVVVGLHTVFEHHEAMTTTALRAFLHENRIHLPVGVDSPSDDGGGPCRPITCKARRRCFRSIAQDTCDGTPSGTSRTSNSERR